MSTTTTTAAPADDAPAVYGRMVGTVPLYLAVCDLCPKWLGPLTTDQQEHQWHVWMHAAGHPEPPARPVEEWGEPGPPPPTRGEEVGRIPCFQVVCDECTRYEGPTTTDRARLDQHIAAHVAVHRAHQAMQADRLNFDLIAAHRDAVKADPGRWY